MARLIEAFKPTQVAALVLIVAQSAVICNAARADDAYVCDGGRLVDAHPDTLERLKATDPCAGGSIGARKPLPQTAPDRSPTGRASLGQNSAVQTPKARSATIAARGLIGPTANPPHSAPSQPHVMKTAGTSVARAGEPQVREATLTPSVSAKPSAPPTGTGADYRNVRVINAVGGDGAVQIFHHDR